MGIISWIVLGLLAGWLAQKIMPGKVRGGLFMTFILGVVGAFVGGFIGSQLGWGKVDEFSIGNLALAVGGAVLVLFIYGAMSKK